MDRVKAMKRLWATANEMWGPNVADFILHCHLIVVCGKASYTEATVEDLKVALDYLNRVGE